MGLGDGDGVAGCFEGGAEGVDGGVELDCAD